MDILLAILAMALVVAAITTLLIPPLKAQVFSVQAIPPKNWGMFLIFMLAAGLILVVVAAN